jgi:hypothetical protein
MTSKSKEYTSSSTRKDHIHRILQNKTLFKHLMSVAFCGLNRAKNRKNDEIDLYDFQISMVSDRKDIMNIYETNDALKNSLNVYIEEFKNIFDIEKAKLYSHKSHFSLSPQAR